MVHRQSTVHTRAFIQPVIMLPLIENLYLEGDVL